MGVRKEMTITHCVWQKSDGHHAGLEGREVTVIIQPGEKGEALQKGNKMSQDPATPEGG
jgi:hypothetical protein